MRSYSDHVGFGSCGRADEEMGVAGFQKAFDLRHHGPLAAVTVVVEKDRVVGLPLDLGTMNPNNEAVALV